MNIVGDWYYLILFMYIKVSFKINVNKNGL